CYRGHSAHELRPGSHSSSPTIGAFPRPAFLRMRLAFPILARLDRSRKYSAVRSAETFSATATLISWFKATPSDSATRFASSKSEVWRRSATLLLLTFCSYASPATLRRAGSYVFQMLWPHRQDGAR